MVGIKVVHAPAQAIRYPSCAREAQSLPPGTLCSVVPFASLQRNPPDQAFILANVAVSGKNAGRELRDVGKARVDEPIGERAHTMELTPGSLVGIANRPSKPGLGACLAVEPVKKCGQRQLLFHTCSFFGD